MFAKVVFTQRSGSSSWLKQTGEDKGIEIRRGAVFALHVRSRVFRRGAERPSEGAPVWL